jgi:uncharacterized paraquat-inducible protein A
MSDTPLTDAHQKAMEREDFDVELALTYEFARQRECENAAMRSAIQEAQSIIAELMLIGSLELPYRRSAALLRAEEVNAHLQTFLPTAATPSASESKERKCPECQRSGPDIPFHLDTGLCARCHHRKQRKRRRSE